jgi:hypothetical protein
MLPERRKSYDNVLSGKRILHAPLEIAGNMAKICKFLRKNHVAAVSAKYYDTWLNYKCDIHLQLNRFPKSQQDSIIDRFAQHAIGEYDIFHFHFGQSLYPDYRDLEILRKRNKKIIFNFWGSDARSPEWILYHQAKYLGYEPPKPYVNTLSQYHLLRHLNKYASVMLGTTAIPRGMRLRGQIDASLWALEEKENLLREKLINKDPNKTYFLHAPTDNWKKGSQLIIPALEDLKKKGWPIELLYVTKLTLEEAKKVYAYADYAIDQVGVGSTGLFGMEMMCWEIPVLVYQIPLFAKIKNFPPVIHITKATLRDRLAECIENKKKGQLIDQGRQARKWVLENEDINATFDEYLEIYADLARDQPVKQYPNPSWYRQEEMILRGLKSDFYQYLEKSGALKELAIEINDYDKRLYL